MGEVKFFRVGNKRVFILVGMNENEVFIFICC